MRDAEKGREEDEGKRERLLAGKSSVSFPPIPFPPMESISEKPKRN